MDPTIIAGLTAGLGLTYAVGVAATVYDRPKAILAAVIGNVAIFVFNVAVVTG